MVFRHRRNFSFSAYERANPDAPKPGAALDAEFSSIQRAVDELRSYVGAGEPSQQRVIGQESEFPLDVALADDFVIVQTALTDRRIVRLPELGTAPWQLVVIRGPSSGGAFNIVVEDADGGVVTDAVSGVEARIAAHESGRYAVITWTGAQFGVLIVVGAYPGVDAESAAARAEAAADRAEAAAAAAEAATGRRLIPVKSFGFATTTAPEGSTAWHEQAVTNGLAFAQARDAAISAGAHGVEFPSTFGALTPITQCLLPTFSTGDVTQTPGRPFEVIGVDEWSTQLQLAAATAGGTAPDALFKHASYGSLTDRAQNSFLRVGRMRLHGLQDFAKDAPVLKIDNTWGCDIHDLIVSGTPGGNAIDVWSFAQGGFQTGDFRRIRGMKYRIWTSTPGGKVLYPRAELAKVAWRYLIGLHGAVDGVGKCNNNKIERLEGYAPIMGYVDTLPFTSAASPNPDRFTETAFPYGGGVDYLLVDDIFGGAVFTNETESNVISAVTSQTELHLVTTAGEWADNVEDMIGYVLKVRNPADNLLYARRIVDADNVTRMVVISRPFPFTVTVGNYYETRICDQKAWDEGMHEDVQIHVVRWGTRVYRGSARRIRCEGCSPAARMSYARATLTIDDPFMWSDRQRGLQIFDSEKFTDPPTNSDYIERARTWAPQYYHGQQARGWEGATAHLITTSIMVGNPDDFDAPGAVPSPLQQPRINDTGAPLLRGGCYRLSSNNERILASIAWTSAGGDAMHYPAYNMSGVPMPKGDIAGMGFGGWTKVLIKPTAGQDIKHGDFLMNGPDNMWLALAPDDVPSDQHHLRRGKVINNYTDDGTATPVLLSAQLTNG